MKEIPPFKPRFASTIEEENEQYRDYILTYYGPTSRIWWRAKFSSYFRAP